MKKTIIHSIILSAAVTASAQADTSPFSKGFQTYANEVAALEKRNGYIGKALPIPDLVQVAEGTYMSVGSFIWGNPSNFGFNNNMTAVIFNDGVFIYNAGPNEAVAYSFHQKLKEVTDKPVKWVAIENHQGHANMGASYWHKVGVKNIYSEKQATEEWHENFAKAKARYMASVGNVLNYAAEDATPYYTVFEDRLTIDVGGGESVELINFGGGHTPTMAGAVVPSRKLVFSGDLGFNERLPGLFEDGSVIEWMESFNRMRAAAPEDAVVIPGHGTACSMDVLDRQTYQYFEDIHNQVAAVVLEGGSIEAASKIDQSKYSGRPVYTQLAKPNAENVYRELYPLITSGTSTATSIPTITIVNK